VSRLLEIEDLSLRMPWLAKRPLLDGVSIGVAAGEVVGLVGESGSGKSLTARAVLRLLPRDAAVDGRIQVGDTEVLTASKDAVRDLRRSTVSMVFQDPRAGINPIRRIGDFLTESLRLNHGWSKDRSRTRALELLQAVGLPDPERHLRQFPHELSGGMLQRVMIAGALTVEPRLLLCDEPTTALDVTTQAEILSILGRLQREQGMGMLFITHDLDLASAVCDRVYVMYAGRIVEQSGSAALFDSPRHPYTAGLLASTPGVDADHDRLVSIPGSPLSLLENPTGCAFASRCAYVQDDCRSSAPPLVDDGDRSVRCIRSGQLAESLRGLGRGEGGAA
jgi:oligopeptide/dipeptide ABC transporter ATP-binding protein